jgi:hypothetical protein
MSCLLRRFACRNGDIERMSFSMQSSSYNIKINNEINKKVKAAGRLIDDGQNVLKASLLSAH